MPITNIKNIELWGSLQLILQVTLFFGFINSLRFQVVDITYSSKTIAQFLKISVHFQKKKTWNGTH